MNVEWFIKKRNRWKAHSKWKNPVVFYRPIPVPPQTYTPSYRYRFLQEGGVGWLKKH